jgi:hypothetical protein
MKTQLLTGLVLLISGIALLAAGAISKGGPLNIWGIFGGIWSIGFGYVLLHAGWHTWHRHPASDRHPAGKRNGEANAGIQ